MLDQRGEARAAGNEAAMQARAGPWPPSPRRFRCGRYEVRHSAGSTPTKLVTTFPASFGLVAVAVGLADFLAVGWSPHLAGNTTPVPGLDPQSVLVRFTDLDDPCLLIRLIYRLRRPTETGSYGTPRTAKKR